MYVLSISPGLAYPIPQANEKSLEGISQAEATQILKSMPSRVVLSVQRSVAKQQTGTTPPASLPKATPSEMQPIEAIQENVTDGQQIRTPESPKYVQPPEIPPTSRPLYSDFSSDTEDELPSNSLSDSYIARSRWPQGEVSRKI